MANDDPDETEGRKLYRAQADALASAKVNIARRRVKMTEEDKEADMSLAKLDAIADLWAEEINMPSIIKNVVSPMRLSRKAPDEVRGQFTLRMEALIYAMMRHAFIEGMVQGMDSLNAGCAKTEK